MHIILVGQRAAGKDTFKDYSFEKYQIPSIRFSTVIGQLGLDLGLATKDNIDKTSTLQFLGKFLRDTYGASYYTEKIIEQIKGKSYIINGMRHPEEFQCLKENLKEALVVVGITAESKIRYQRARKLKIVSSLKEFEKLENHPAEAKITQLLQQADTIIENSTTPEAFHQQIDRFWEDYEAS